MDTPAPVWLKRSYCALFALLPWSVEAHFEDWSLSVPAEPLLGVVALFLLFFLRPPHLRAILSNNGAGHIGAALVGWMAICACFSCQPLVSWKYCVVEALHSWVFIAGIAAWPGLWRQAFPWYAASISGLTVYTLAQHANYDFRADQALLAAKPFFQNHTLWATALSLTFFITWLPVRGMPPLPPVFYAWFPFRRRASKKWMLVGGLLALVFSMCRAAWATMTLAFLFWFHQRLSPPFRRYFEVFLLLGGVLIGLMIVDWRIEDVSVRERINRWHCALEMGLAAPVTGFGPGTFQFQYIDYQQPEYRTRISLSAPQFGHGADTYGRGGGAHSEYGRALAETGVPGLALFLWLSGYILWVKRPKKWEEAGVWLALFVFFSHGLVNDFLHEGKIAALIWGGMAWWCSRKTR